MKNSKSFWSKIKELNKKQNKVKDSNISTEQWFNYFKDLFDVVNNDETNYPENEANEDELKQR